MENREPARWITVIRASVGYAGYGLSGALFLLLVPFSAIFFAVPSLRPKVLKTISRLYCAFLTRLYLPLLQIYRIAEISGYRRSRQHEPAVYIANHRGRLDGPLLLGLIRNTGVIMKSRYARQPVYSSFVKHLDYISVDPHSMESLADALQQSRQLIKGGKNLLVFPEGTRATTGRLLPFRDFAFRIARDTGVPVIPILVHSDLPFMGKIKGSHFPRRKFSYRVRFLEPMHAQENETPVEFAARARQVMTELLAPLDEGTPWETGRQGVG